MVHRPDLGRGRSGRQSKRSTSKSVHVAERVGAECGEKYVVCHRTRPAIKFVRLISRLAMAIGVTQRARSGADSLRGSGAVDSGLAARPGCRSPRRGLQGRESITIMTALFRQLKAGVPLR